MGLGCWAIGGPWTYDSKTDEPNAAGWGEIDDKESIRAIHAGLDLGINFFDTAANYGAGHSERVLAKALAGRRDQAVIATKFGYLVDEDKKLIINDQDVIIENIRQDCENSLLRLNADYIDLYQFHVGDYSPEKADAVRDALEELVNAGKIRWYGWSTDNSDGARVFAEGEHCTAIQQDLYWCAPANYYSPTLQICEKFNLASVNRSPLGMGLLTGKFYRRDMKLPNNDIRHDWNFREGEIADIVQQVENLKDILTSGGRTLAQGALCWLWALSEVTIPIPGFKTVEQVTENAKAMDFGPLASSQMDEISKILQEQ